MCEQASIQDTALKKVCQAIITSQTSEIAQMKAIMARMEEK